MTGRLLFLSCLAYALIAFGIGSLNGGILALLVPILVYLGSSLLFGANQPNLIASRTLDVDTVAPGRQVTVTLKVTNSGETIEELLIEDLVPKNLEIVSGDVRLLAALPSGESIVLTYVVRGPRGNYRFNHYSATSRDTLGILGRVSRLTAEAKLLILPEVPRIRVVPIRPLRTHGFAGPIPARQRGSGVDFFGLREYQLGDPLRAVNWRVTARHEEALFTNEFEQERIADVGLILDARQQSEIHSEAGSLFEHSVRATAALADSFLREGNRVGLLVYGWNMERAFPGYGKVQRDRILRTLARARTGSNFALENLEYLPTRFFPPRSQIILVSSMLQDDLQVLTQLRAVGYSVIVVSPDPVSFEARLADKGKIIPLAVRLARIERVTLIRNLQRVGIQVIDWKVEQPFQQAIQSAVGHLVSGLRHNRIAL
jgi:uncharacterized repeat protein (TIGR01451 family)